MRRPRVFCPVCKRVDEATGRSPGSQIVCRCGQVLIVPDDASTILERLPATGHLTTATGPQAGRPGVVAYLARQQGIDPPRGLPDVRSAVEAAGRRRYVVGEPIGRGGMGQVTSWLDADLGRWVAVKTLAPEAADDESFRVRFLAEGRLAAQLEHPAIVPVHEQGVDEDGRPYFAMARLEGRTLDEAAGDLPTSAALRDIRRVAEALDYAHDQGVVHRDVKPSNIFLGPRGDVYLIDWGLAHFRGQEVTAGTDSRVDLDDSEMTLAGTILGTPAYMAPEQAAGRTVDRRSDVYGLGATLYFCLTGTAPYDGRSVDDVLWQLGEGPPPSVRARAPERRIPRDLEAIVERAMARHRSGRYQTARDLAADLGRFEAGLEVAARPLGPLGRSLRRLRRRPRLLAIGTTLLAAALLGGVWATLATLREQRLADREAASRESRRAATFARNLDAANEATEGRSPDTPALLEALVRYRIAHEHASGPVERRAAADGLAATHLDLARRAIALAIADGRTTGPVEGAIEHVAEARAVDGASLDPAVLAGLERQAVGRTDVVVASDGPGPPIRIHRLPRGGVEPGQLVRAVEPGTALRLDNGGYLLLAEGPEGPPTRLPVSLERGLGNDRTLLVPRPRRAPPGFVFVPGGRFRSGPEGHPATVDRPFFIARHELTWAEYIAFLDDLGPSGRQHEPSVRADGRIVAVRSSTTPDPDHPVFGVRYVDAVVYLRWRSSRDPDWNYRLPTPAEWEWAARGADGRRFPWGDRWQPDLVYSRANRRGFSAGDITEAVGRRPEGRSVFGLYQMAGNLSEWVDQARGERVHEMRGGFWNSLPHECTTFSTSPTSDDVHGGKLGLRLVADPVR